MAFSPNIFIYVRFLYLVYLLFNNIETNAADSLDTEKNKLLNGETIVDVYDIDDDIIGVTGKILIASEVTEVWEVLVDYDSLHKFIPGVIDSKLLQTNDGTKIIEQIGRTQVLIFSKTVYVKLEVREEYLKRISFNKIDGDFKVYNGEWIIDYDEELRGTILIYKANVEPDFFSPMFITRYVQNEDLPVILEAIRNRVEFIKQAKIKFSN